MTDEEIEDLYRKVSSLIDRDHRDQAYEIFVKIYPEKFSSTSSPGTAPKDIPIGVSDSDFLKDLIEKLRHVPANYGIDDYHIDRLSELQQRLNVSLQ